MPRNSDPSRIYHDPALADRRGDATGPVALLFLVLIIGAFVAVAWGLVTYLPVAVDPTPRPTPSAAPVTPRPSPTPVPSATSQPGPSAGPGATDRPRTTREPSVSPEPRASREPGATLPPPPARTGRIDEVIPVIRNGQRLGSVRMTSFEAGDVPGVDLPAGARFMIMEITYATAFGMPYDAADWFIEDAEGVRYPSLGDDAPEPALGSGRVAADAEVTGNVAFIREQHVRIERIVLTDRTGKDLVAIERPPA